MLKNTYCLQTTLRIEGGDLKKKWEKNMEYKYLSTQDSGEFVLISYFICKRKSLKKICKTFEL